MKDTLFLNPGGYFFGQHSGYVVTLLGSCVAFCAWHPEKKLLLASHVVLPERPTDELLKDTRYGDVVIQSALADMYKHKTNLNEYKLALFGGSSTIYEKTDYKKSVGAKNIAFMRDRIERVLNAQFHALDIGGHQHRRLNIDAQQGGFQVQYLQSLPFTKG